MQAYLLFSLGTVATLLSSLPAAASSSAWFQSEGGKVRLVTTGAPDEAGRLQGALEIMLKPGWKT
ncbi:MAG: protein-disulfide reductase DsbD domain-containing protein, partial [Mesorhizobium sp.]